MNILMDIDENGSVSFVSYPQGAEIFMDGVDQVIKTPAIVTDVPAGGHEYVLKLAGYKDSQGSTIVLEGATSGVTVNLIPASDNGLIAGAALMGAGVLVIAMA